MYNVFQAQRLLKKLGKENIHDLKLTEYELNIAAQLIVPKGNCIYAVVFF